MTIGMRKPYEIVWFEPLAGLVLLVFALFVNRFVEWPWMWVIDILACTGAALSYRFPAIGAGVTALSLGALLTLDIPVVSASGMAFYINVFAAARKNLTWKAPLVLGLTGLAYLALVRKAVESPADRWPTAMILLIVLVMAYGGGLAFRHGIQRIQREQETGHKRLQDLQTSLARELHDSVAQTLSSAAMRANIVMGDPSLSPLALDQLERIADECRASAHDLRQLLSALREDPSPAVSTGPLADVDTLKQSVKAQAQRLRGEGFIVDVDIQLNKLSAARCQTLAAITVEAANNVLKHGKPHSTCMFSITTEDDQVIGEFSNVMRTSRAAHPGFGLTGVQERLGLLNGTSTVMRRGNRWILRAQLPLGLEGANPPAIPAPERVPADDAPA